MKILPPSLLSLTLLVAACTGSPQVPVEDRRAVAASDPAGPVHNYRCESGAIIVASYPANDSAMVQYKGRSYNMKIAVSASGARYVGGELVWWAKGSGAGSAGTLFQHMAGGVSGESIEICAEL